MNYWFTADTHWNHARIIEYSKRPFSSVDEMNEKMISNWNEVINKGDVVYHIGDFGFTRRLDLDPYPEMKLLLGRLNGQINLIIGNHDAQNYNQKVLSLFSSISLLRDKTINGQRIIMCHYPLLSWAGKGKESFMLHGHCHYNMNITKKEGKFGKILDVGVDGNKFYPYSFEEISKIMDKKPIFSKNVLFNDHHVEKEDI